MIAFADYSQVTTAGQIHAALLQGGLDGVTHYLAGNNALRIEDPQVVREVRALGWPQMGISVPTLGSVNGAVDAGRARDSYGCPPGMIYWLDVEPSEFAADPTGWAVAADRWCDDVRVGGYAPGIYGTDPTVAACANRADRIWRAKPGMCDPAGPGLDPTFFAGRRAVQCSAAVLAGLSVDISYSQFPLEVTMTAEQAAQLAYLYQQWNNGPAGGPKTLRDYFGDIFNGVAALQGLLTNPPGTGLTVAQAQQLSDLVAAVGRLEAGLRQA